MGYRQLKLPVREQQTSWSIYASKMGVDIINYLDDIGGADVEEMAKGAFKFLGELLQYLGFTESGSKACVPATRMVFLGIVFDRVEMVTEVTPERIWDRLEKVRRWATKETASKEELQVLLRKLHFVCKCVRKGHVFVSRLLNLLRETSERGVNRESVETKADIRWFEKFLPEGLKNSCLSSTGWPIPEAKWREPDSVCNRCLLSQLWGRMWGWVLWVWVSCQNQPVCSPHFSSWDVDSGPGS